MSTTSAGPARNRVSPLGDIIAVPGRGAWMGNRGRLHEGSGARDVVRNHQSKAWLICVLSFKGRRAPQWHPHRYTPLFFLDEAVALAAGHRPCAECRRPDFNVFRDAWWATHGGTRPYAPDIDAQLHGERRHPGRAGKRLHTQDWANLPDGSFVLVEPGPAVVVGDHLAVWNAADNCYARQLPRPVSRRATVLTPPSTVAVLRSGYPVQIDPAAR
jgi:hypothetical protein